jgi:phosphoglycolate phosphatase-like HAD superfamily hydrolase
VIRVVLFDIDGTLIRTGGAGVRAFERAFALEFGVEHATRGVSFAGRTDTSLVRQCFLKHAIPPKPDNFTRFFDAYVFLLQHLLESTRGAPCPGVSEFIGETNGLSNPPILGLLTGNVRLGAEIKLRHYALWELFRFGAFGDDHEDRNCLAAMAQQRAAELAGAPVRGEEILVVGDTPRDIECAKSIGAQVLAVGTGGYSCAELQAHTPTWVFKNLLGISAQELLGAR